MIKLLLISCITNNAAINNFVHGSLIICARVSLEQWFSTENHFCHRGHMITSRDIFACYIWVGRPIGIRWIEIRDTAKHPAMH